jgi:hypothetical protein
LASWEAAAVHENLKVVCKVCNLGVSGVDVSEGWGLGWKCFELSIKVNMGWNEASMKTEQTAIAIDNVYAWWMR